MKASIDSKQPIWGVQLHMMPLIIKDNKSPRYWLRSPKAELCCITLIIEDTGTRFNGYINMGVLSGVENNQYLDVNKLLYKWEGACLADAPNRLFVISSIVKRKRALKDLAPVITKVKEDECFQQLAHSISSVVPETASFPFIVNVAMKIVDVVKTYLGKESVPNLAATANYFNKCHGDLDKPGIISLSRGTQNVDFSFELNVYNRGINEIFTNEINDIAPLFP